MTHMFGSEAFIFGEGNSFENFGGSRKGSKGPGLNPFAARRRARERLIARVGEENRLHRKPCPTCGTLVKPELQDQHNEAYHPA